MQILTALTKFQIQLEADGRSPHTIKQYQRHIRLFALWLATEGHGGSIGTINHEMVARFLASNTARKKPDGGMKRSTSMNALRSSTRTFFNWCDAAGYVRKNPARLVKRAVCGTPPPKALNDSDERRLIGAFKEAATPEDRRDVALFTLMLLSGLRIGSALNLDVQDIDFERSEIRLRHAKGDREDLVYINKATRKMLQDYLGERSTGPVFLTIQGRRPSSRHIERRFRMWLQRAGITRRLTPHGLRHSFGCRLYARTGDLYLVQRAMTHRSIASTTVYARVPESRIRQALEA